jgi:SNF2 family DNA or RNA helicase
VLVLHAIWNHFESENSTLNLWAETSDVAPTLTHSISSGRKPARGKTAEPGLHPFAIPPQVLRETLRQCLPLEFLEGADFGTITLRLPSQSGRPLPSPELIPAEEAEKVGVKKVELAGWEIPCLAFRPEKGLDVLLKLPVESPNNISFGSSVRFWVEAAKFFLELLGRQSFEPALLEINQNGKAALAYRPGWKISLGEEADQARLEALQKALPPVCRALLPTPTPPSKKTTPAGPSDRAVWPSELIDNFLNQTLEATLHHSFQAAAGITLAANKARPIPAGSGRDDLPTQWVKGLYGYGENPLALTAPPARMKAFLPELEEWLGRLKPVDTTAPFRTCFKLEPLQPNPENEREAYLTAVKAASKSAPGSPPWLLTFYLQANSDRSLLIEAEQVWRERSSTVTFLKQRFENPQERLLADLGKASRMYPTLEKSLQAARPTGLTLNTEEAYTFLRQSAPLLEQSGFGVILPPWWTKPAQKLGLKLTMNAKGAGKTGSGILTRDSLVEYNWQVALGDQTLSMAEFEKLARLKVPLVQLRGQWVELRPEQIEAAIAFFDKQRAKGQMSLEDALKFGLGQDENGLNEVGGLGINGVESDGWIKELLEKLANSSKIGAVPQPGGLQAKLRPYQLKGLAWLNFLGQYELGACLADDMGLGKTIQLISLLLHERETAGGVAGSPQPAERPAEQLAEAVNGKGATAKLREKGKAPAPGTEEEKLGPTLLVCPMSVVGNWSKELARFAPSLRVLVHHGGQRLSGPEFEEAVGGADVVLTTYALLSRDEEALNSVKWERVALDEAQNIKNQAAKQTQAVRRLQTRYRVALTGTPVENRLSELWSIMHFLNPGYLGSATEFRTRFGAPIEKYHDQERSEVLKKLIQPFVLRRLKTDKSIIADLPEKNEMKVWCNLTREQASLYEAVVKDMVAQIEEAEASGIQRRGLILATLLKLKQVCNHPAQFMGDRNSSVLEDRSGKLIRLEEMLQEALEEGDKALIFSQFAEMGAMLKPYLQQRLGREVLFLHGGTSRKLRDEMVQRFQDTRPGTPPLFLLSLKAGGVGLNLTAANHVFHFDRWWNPAVENQATDRAFRIGQQKNVQVHKFVCIGTLEERIDTMIEQKKGLAESIVGQSENWITEMSNKELRALFALDRSAVAD